MVQKEIYCDENMGTIEYRALSELIANATEDMYIAVDYNCPDSVGFEKKYFCVCYIGSDKAEWLVKVTDFDVSCIFYKQLKDSVLTYIAEHITVWTEFIWSEYKKLTQPVSTYSRENSINVYRIERAADKALFTAVIFPNKVEIFSGLAYMPYATLHGIYTPHAVIAYLDNELQIGCDRKEPAMVGEHSHRI